MKTKEEAIQEIEIIKKKFLSFLAKEKLEIKKKKVQIDEIEGEMNKPGFWDDAKKAKNLSEQLNEMKDEVEPLERIAKDLEELEETKPILDDESIKEEVFKKIKSLKAKIKDQKANLKDKNIQKHAKNNALMQLSSGAGGVDAKDWTEMLLRMYLRFAKEIGLEAIILEKSQNDEAGINGVFIKFKGTGAYAKLYKENGVHRLVRLSPFNANNLRQTSFAKVEVIPEIAEPQIDINENDLKIETFRASGAGGQHVNTTDSAVRITHLPTQTTVICQNERSQLKNRDIAKKALFSKLEFLNEEKKREKEKELKGEYKKAEWGNQVRSYILHPYKMVKNHQSKKKSSKVEDVLSGNLSLIQ